MTNTSTPRGAVTFVMTDVEGSTGLWEAHSEAMRTALEIHDRIAREAFADHGGYVFSTAGDSFAAAFSSALDASAAAVALQRRLLDAQWPETGPLRVRCGLHTGAAHERGGDYFGPPLNRCARLMAIAHGSQVLISGATAGLVASDLPEGVTLLDLGTHRLKDLEAAEHVFQLCHPALPDRFPPLRSLGAFATNLPQQSSSFVGRASELTQLGEMLDAGALVTLVGPGGAGKTRLAMHAAADALDGFPGGVWFVDLAALTEPDLIAHVTAEALGLEEGSGDLVATISATLSRARAMLVMDNCEHLIIAAASLAATLLTTTPSLTILATSQEPLNITGEAVVRVEPMLVNDSADLAALMESDAVRLFVERATSSDPTFVLDDNSVALIAEICRRLDGIPLAIELAAARYRHLGLADIAARLDNRFNLLNRGSRAASMRHQTLRNTVDWSYGLLDGDQQVLFRRLSVFAGSFGVDAVEHVCGFEPLDPDVILDLLSALIDRSLVHVEPGTAGRSRYRLLETLRLYGSERLDEAYESEAALAHHSDFFVDFAGEAQVALRGDHAASWHDRVASESDDLRVVIQRAIAAAEIDTAARIAVGSWYHWYVSGRWDEGYRWLSQVNDLAASLDPALRADVLRGLGGLATAMQRLSEGIDILGREIEIRRSLDDEPGLSAAILNLANAYALDGRYPDALDLYDQSLEISRRIGEEVSSVTSNVAWTALDMGDYELAGLRFAETYDLATTEGERRNQAWGRLGGGVVAWLGGDLIAAQSFLELAREIFIEYGETPMVAFCETFEAKVARDRGDLDPARELMRSAAGRLAELDDPGGVVRWLVAAGGFECRRHRFAEAARLFGAAGDQAELPPWEREEYHRALPELVEALGTERLDDLKEQGRVADREGLLRTSLVD